MAILQERRSVRQEVPLAFGEAGGKGGLERVDLRRRGRLREELAERAELPLLQELVAERGVLHRVQHAQQEVGERHVLPKRWVELRDAEREAPAHRIEVALVELRRSHSFPPWSGFPRGARCSAAR